MNVLFVYSGTDPIHTSRKPLAWPISLHLGISYIASALQQKGIKPELLVLPSRVDHAAIRRALARHNPELVCFTSVYREHEVIRNAAECIKALRPEAFLLLGGPHATLNAKDLHKPPFDAVCIGEGEHATLEIAAQLQRGEKPAAIDGVLFGDDNEEVRPRPFITDLDELPHPNREIWRPWCVFASGIHTILVSRGCPYDCSYCCNHALRKASQGCYVRYRSPRSVVTELAEILDADAKCRFVYFESECLNADIQFAHGLADALCDFRSRSSNRTRFGANIKVIPGQDYDALLEHLAAAGFMLANVGLESGNSEVRQQILRRTYSNEDVAQVVNAAKRHGLFVRMYAMIGIPGETRERFQDTVDCVKRLKPDLLDLSFFYPYPGTDAYRQCQEMGLLDKMAHMRNERRRPAYSLPGFSAEEMRREYRTFFKKSGTPRPAIGLYRFLTRSGLLPFRGIMHR